MTDSSPSVRRLFGTDSRVMALGFARMADALGNSFLIVTLPLYIASDHITGGQFGLTPSFIAGVVLGLFGLVNSFVQPFAGRFSDRTGRRRLFIVAGLLLLAMANAAFSFVTSYAGMMGVRALQGLGAALTITASVALINEISVTGERGNNMGVYNAFRLVGFGLGPLAAGIVIQGGPYPFPLLGALSGYDTAFVVAAAAALLSAGLVTGLVQDPPTTHATTERLALRLRADAPGRVLDPIFTLGLATFFMSLCFALLTPIEPTVNERLGQGPVLFSVEFVALIAVLAVAQPLIGRASDRYGRKQFIVAGLLGLIPTTLMQGLVTMPWEMIVARGAQGLAAAAIYAPALALAGDLAKEGQSGAQLAVLTMAFGLGISAGQFLSGFAVRYGFAVPFAVGAVLALLGAGLVQTQVVESEMAWRAEHGSNQ